MPIRQDQERLRTVLQQLGSGKVFNDLICEMVPTPAPQKGLGPALAALRREVAQVVGGVSCGAVVVVYIGGDNEGGCPRWCRPRRYRA